MCYSAHVQESWREFTRRTGVHISIHEFVELFKRRLLDPASYRLPRGFELEFAHPRTDDERAIKTLIDEYRATQVRKCEAEVFAQRKRLADAERKLAVKETKAAAESKRIASAKVQLLLDRLTLLKGDKRHADDYRIFPRCYAPIIVMHEGRKLMVPARYLLRQSDAPPSMDDKLSGNYNARRDNLSKFWRRQFGATHAVMVIESFYENVTAADGQNQVLQFVPRPSGPMWIACLFDEGADRSSGETLRSFAAITDAPPPEVAAAGHDRMIVSLAPEAVDRWLTPQGRTDDELQAILDERQRPYYEHAIAA